ncbi:MAG: FAD binding domain-containing protein [Trebonia sp.]
MKPVTFDLVRPADVDEALAELSVDPDESKLLAGGQSLVPLLNFRLARPARLIDLARIQSLRGITRDYGRLSIGAMTTQHEAEQSDLVRRYAPLLAAALPRIAHPPIRSRGTVGGSTAHADPAAEIPAVVLALDATIRTRSAEGSREVSAAEFFHGFLTTALAADELLTAVELPVAPPGTGAAFLEVARRHGDFALVGAAVQLTLREGAVTDCRLVLTGVSDRPCRLREVEALVTGTSLDEATADRAAAATEESISPPGDLHATAGYRRHVAGVLVQRGLREAHRRAAGQVAIAS